MERDTDAPRRLLRNLVENANKYDRGVRLSGQVVDRWVEVTVQDDGPGTPQEHLAHVFEPFYRVDASRARDSGGTGLGLAIVRAIAESHGGTVSLRNRPQGGLDATVGLPA
ncbi:MAG: sensor histidine kinase [Candidatus Xenobia bacterium]